MKNGQKKSKKKIIFRIAISLVVLYIFAGLWGNRSILMGKEINVTKNVSTGIQYNDKIFFLCDYKLKEPGWYLYVIFIPGKIHYDAVHLYSYNLKTGELNQISEIKSYFDRNFTKWERDGSSIFFTTQGGWDKSKRKTVFTIFKYNTISGEITKYNTGESERLYNKYFKDKNSFHGKDKIKISGILFHTGILQEEEWGLPEAADYSGMNKKNFKKAIVESSGTREFRESVYRKIRDDLSSEEIFDMISTMEKIHSKREGVKKMEKDLIVKQWLSRLYIEAEYGKKPFTKEQNKSIHRAVYWKDRDELTRLISKGIDPDSRDSEGLTPLMIAAYINDSAIIELLLKNGADINACDNKGCTSLVYAVFGKSHLAIKTLFENGATRSVNDKTASYAWIFVASTPLRQWYLHYEKRD
jgi:hypothetical protein